MAVRDLLPLFPLPNVVLFPNVFLPLHIFEPRYREMVSDALSSDRLIGMVLLCPGWQQDYEGRPPVYPIGCSGLITHVEQRSDGHYNIVLRGIERFRILEEDASRAYRCAVVEAVQERPVSGDDRAAIRTLRTRLEHILTPPIETSSAAGATGHDPRVPAAMSDEDLIHALAQYLDLEPIEKQALLERPCLRTRASSLVELLEMKMMAARAHGGSNFAH